MNPIHKLIGEAEDFSEYADILALDAEQEKTLFNREPKLTPEDLYNEALEDGRTRRSPEEERIIATSATYAMLYATEILLRGAFVPGSKRFPLAEPVIASEPKTAYYYARDVIKGRWAMGEKAISKSGSSSYLYAKNILKSGWFSSVVDRATATRAVASINRTPNAVPYARFLKSLTR